MVELTEKTRLLPSAFSQARVGKMNNEAVLPPDASIPPCASFAANSNPYGGRRFPQAIDHRGYKVAYPENTMGAFKGAIKVDSQAIETDVHLTKDNVVVLSHDATLKRCFGQPEKLKDVDWSWVKTLWTTEEPKQHMPRLQDLLELLAKPENEHIWVCLDIKMDNPDEIMHLIANTLSLVEPSSPSRPWSTRIVLGCWAARSVSLASQYLPGYPIAHIGFSLSYARQFLDMPNVSFSMLLTSLMSPCGRRFMADCRARGRPVLAWTVNTEEKMEWCIRRGIDGVLTDDPKYFLEVCRRHEKEGNGEEGEAPPEKPLSWRTRLDVMRVWIFASAFASFYWNWVSIKRTLC